MRLIDADAYQKALEDKAEQLKNRNIIDDALNDTINGLCGAVSILYEQPTVQPHKKGRGRRMTKEEIIIAITASTISVLFLVLGIFCGMAMYAEGINWLR